MLSVESIINNWDYIHFVLYLSICTAEADYVIKEDEKNIIRTRMKSIGVQGLNFEALYNEVHTTFKMLKDIQSIELIKGLGKKYCSDDETRDSILKFMNEIVDSDKSRLQTERIILREIKWLLDNY